MRRDGGLQRATVVLLQTTLVMGILVGCVAVPRPADGIRDLPHIANQGPSPHVSVARETIWTQ